MNTEMITLVTMPLRVSFFFHRIAQTAPDKVEYYRHVLADTNVWTLPNDDKFKNDLLIKYLDDTQVTTVEDIMKVTRLFSDTMVALETILWTHSLHHCKAYFDNSKIVAIKNSTDVVRIRAIMSKLFGDKETFTLRSYVLGGAFFEALKEHVPKGSVQEQRAWVFETINNPSGETVNALSNGLYLSDYESWAQYARMIPGHFIELRDMNLDEEWIEFELVANPF